METTNEKPEYVYRIMPLRHFLSTLKRGKLYLPRVSKWDDPYELFLFKQQFVKSSGMSVDTMSEAYRIYGQCWTTARDSDALWRIYSPDRMSVRIKTTVQNIEQLTEKSMGNGLLVKSGKVDYKNQNEINAYVKSLTGTSVTNTVLQDSLFIKRSSFEHEKEYRIIAWMADFDENNNYTPSSPEYIEIPFPDDFIQEVYLDPRLSQDEVAMLKPALALRLGGSCPVSQSTLYKFKQQTIQIP